MALTQHEFYTLLEKYRKKHPAERYGQAAFNLMYELLPDIANEYRASDYDPFYRDERTAEFVNLCLTKHICLSMKDVKPLEVPMILQNPGEKNHTIFITIGVKVNYGDAENPDNPYSSEDISETLGEALKCPACGNWHWNQNVCGMDEAWLEDVSETKGGD